MDTEAKDKQYVHDIVEYITKYIISKAGRKTEDSSPYSSNMRVLIKNALHSSKILPSRPHNTYLPDIIVKMKTRFPDTRIVIDPVATHLLIDWS